MIEGNNIIIFLLIYLFIIIYLSLYYSKSLREKYIKIKESLGKWFYNLYISKDGKTLIMKSLL